MTEDEVIQILSDDTRWGGTAAEQIARNRREMEARSEAVRYVKHYRSCYRGSQKVLSKWINAFHRAILLQRPPLGE